MKNKMNRKSKLIACFLTMMITNIATATRFEDRNVVNLNPGILGGEISSYASELSLDGRYVAFSMIKKDECSGIVCQQTLATSCDKVKVVLLPDHELFDEMFSTLLSATISKQNIDFELTKREKPNGQNQELLYCTLDSLKFVE